MTPHCQSDTFTHARRPRLLVVVLLGLVVQQAFCGSHVEYVYGRPFTQLLSPVELLQLCRTVQGSLCLTNIDVTNETLVGWCLKKSDADKPPILEEESVLYFQARGKQTNEWVVAHIRRTAARGRPGMDIWGPALSYKGMAWVARYELKPSTKDLTQFMRQSNFGNNECAPDIQTIYVSIYSPFKPLVRGASRALPTAKKQRRYGLMDVLY
jgi:hypothetical protein